MKKIILILLILPLFIYADELNINAKSSILIEESTGTVLYEKNANEHLAPASMTKIMSLILIMEAIEEGKITKDDMVYISPYAASMGGSQVFLESGTSMRAEELLKAITVASANDAVVALAEHISSSTSVFVNEMNEKAKSLGCHDTNFVNPHGLDDDNHYSSAHDMALMAKELLKHKDILNYTTIYEAYLNKPDGSSTWMVNTNKLIKYYNGLDGLKTGYTKNAGYSLTATAKRNDMRLISVVMKEEDSNIRSNDTITLLNYGFSTYKIKNILDTNKVLGKYYVINGKNKAYLVLKEDANILEEINDNNTYTYNIKLNTLKAPIKVGDTIGYLEVIKDNIIINNIDITVKDNVDKASIFTLIKRNINKILVGS